MKHCHIENTDQLRRYRSTFPNLIVLAKYLKGRWGRVLAYLRICTAVAWTITLRAERDTVYQAMEAGRLLEKVI